MRKIVDRTILILNILASLSLCIAYLAPVVNPSKFIIPALFGLAYPYLLMLNLVILSYWLIRLKREVFLSIVVILLGWNHLNNLIPIHFRSTEIPETVSVSRLFKVLSYNVRGFDVYGWSSDPQVKKEIFNFISEQDPDILCFQEYFASSKQGQSEMELSRALRFLPESAVYYTSDQANRSGFGIATYSRYPIIKKSRIPFNSSSNAAMYTDILVHRDTVRIINVHLQSIKFGRDDYAFMDTVRLKYSNEQIRGIRHIGIQLKTAFSQRAEQAKMIANYIQDSPYPLVVMGDFNDTPQSFAYRKIKRTLKDAFRKAGKGFGNTYAGELPSFRIDYIMYSQPLVPYRFERIKNDFSDHFPISTWMYHPVPVIDE